VQATRLNRFAFTEFIALLTAYLDPLKLFDSGILVGGELNANAKTKKGNLLLIAEIRLNKKAKLGGS